MSGDVAESVYALDLKSNVGNGIRVQVPSSPPFAASALKEAIEAHIAAVQALYRPLLANHGRLTGGGRLLASFEQSVAAYRKTGRRQINGVIERVNELTVAHKLLCDPQFTAAAVAYEPQIIPGPKFDFVVRRTGQSTLYIEVKTVSPHAAIDAASWQKATYRGRPATPRNPHSGTAVQAAFRRYTLQTENKLTAHVPVEPGKGLLILCGDGLCWSPTALTDFAAPYRGPLNFGCLIRRQDAVEPTAWTFLNPPCQRKEPG